jgi:hypothetical protein
MGFNFRHAPRRGENRNCLIARNATQRECRPDITKIASHCGTAQIPERIARIIGTWQLASREQAAERNVGGGAGGAEKNALISIIK